MLAPDLHPEELLDRVRAGRATDDDTARWSEHLRHCAVCRLECQLEADFGVEEGSAPGAPPSGLLLANVLERALPRPVPDASEPVAPIAGEPSPPPSRRPARGRRRSRLLVALVAALAAMLLGTFAAAAASAGWTPWAGRVPGPVSGAPAAVRVTGGLFSRLAPRSLPGARVATERAPAGATVTATGAASGESTAGSGTPGASEAESARAAPRVDADARAGGAAGSAELFRTANAARRSGDLARARSLYRQLIERHGASPEARVARAVLARLALDEGRAGEAVDDYDAYLAGGSAPLSEAALVGRAVALERSGRRAEARAAWQALLRAHPNTPHRVRAQGRIAALAGP